MMAAARTSETSVNYYQTTRCNDPEDSHLHTHCHENVKSHLCKFSPYREENATLHHYKDQLVNAV
jgi:hypothetical protein